MCRKISFKTIRILADANKLHTCNRFDARAPVFTKNIKELNFSLLLDFE